MSLEPENQDRRVDQDHAEDDADLQAGSQYESDASDASSSPSTTDVLTRNRQSTYDILTKFAINMFFPLLNGMMLGFGEILAHELGFRWGWYGSRVFKPSARNDPSVDVVSDDGTVEKRRQTRTWYMFGFGGDA